MQANFDTSGKRRKNWSDMARNISETVINAVWVKVLVKRPKSSNRVIIVLGGPGAVIDNIVIIYMDRGEVKEFFGILIMTKRRQKVVKKDE